MAKPPGFYESLVGFLRANLKFRNNETIQFDTCHLMDIRVDTLP